jgi:hypothetical protein
MKIEIIKDKIYVEHKVQPYKFKNQKKRIAISGKHIRERLIKEKGLNPGMCLENMKIDNYGGPEKGTWVFENLSYVLPRPPPKKSPRKRKTTKKLDNSEKDVIIDKEEKINIAPNIEE